MDVSLLLKFSNNFLIIRLIFQLSSNIKKWTLFIDKKFKNMWSTHKKLNSKSRFHAISQRPFKIKEKDWT